MIYRYYVPLKDISAHICVFSRPALIISRQPTAPNPKYSLLQPKIQNTDCPLGTKGEGAGPVWARLAPWQVDLQASLAGSRKPERFDEKPVYKVGKNLRKTFDAVVNY